MTNPSVKTLLPIRPPAGMQPGHRVVSGPLAAPSMEHRGETAFLCGHCLTPILIERRSEDYAEIPPSQCYRCLEWSIGRIARRP
jgi:hypothetical protein